MPLQPLRAILQHVESKGTVDFSLGGHSCSRPPEVQQGKAADAFVVQPDTTNPLVWRPQAVQQKALKPANLASHFAYPLINASPLVLATQLTTL